MKKLFLALGAAAIIALSSCGTSTDEKIDNYEKAFLKYSDYLHQHPDSVVSPEAQRLQAECINAYNEVTKEKLTDEQSKRLAEISTKAGNIMSGTEEYTPDPETESDNKSKAEEAIQGAKDTYDKIKDLAK